MKIQRNNHIFSLFIAIFIIFAGVLFFGNTDTSHAAGNCKTTDTDGAIYNEDVPSKEECDKKGGIYTEYTGGTCTYKKKIEGDGPVSCQTTAVNVSSKEECDKKGSKECGIGGTFTTDRTVREETKEIKKQIAAKNNSVCRDVDFNWGEGILTCALLHVLDMNGSILKMSLALFKSTADATKTTAVLSSGAIQETWKTVRDLANLSFILILVFSAFATIFQVDKYNYKKILLWLIIIALLVNFSYPITLFIIDISNSLMYTLFKQALGDKEVMLALDPVSKPLADIIYPGPDATLSGLLLSIVFIFILALTMLALALIILIRTIALAILIIFSPLGFVGSIIGKGGDWWSSLSKYALAGPIIGLVLLIAIKLMEATSQLASAGNSAGLDEPLVVAMAKFTVPIVILWMGMGMAIKGIDGAGAVMGKVRGGGVNLAKKFGKGTLNATGIPGTIKQTADHYKKKGIMGIGGSENREDREKKWTAALTGDKGFADRKEQHDMAEKSKKYKDENETIANLRSKCQAGDAAACHRLAEDGDMDSDTYSSMEKHPSISSKLKSTINKKVRQKRADLVATYDVKNTSAADIASTRTSLGAMANGWSDNRIRDHIAEEKMGGLSAEKFAEQNWVDINKLPATTPAQTEEKTRIARATLHAIGGLTPEARVELGKRLSTANRTAINTLVGYNII